MEDSEGARHSTLAEQAQEQNSNLQRLIEAIVQLIATSRELLGRLQPGNKTTPPDASEQE